MTNISTDSLNPNAIQVSIFYAASASSFTNYPYISALLDCHGDTVATGNLFVFGQFGQSTVAYPLTLNLSNPCEPLTAVFLSTDNFGVTDTCQLVYAGTTSIENHEDKIFDVFPNPSKDLVVIQVPSHAIGETMEWRDLTGKLMITKVLTEETFSMNVTDLPSGTYLIQYGNALGNAVLRAKICIE